MNSLTGYRNQRLLKATVATGLVFLCSTGWATLGQIVPSGSTTPVMGSSPARMNASGANTASSYGVRSTTLISGTVVSEYATPAGLVFAISWKGPTMPDLNALLGNYFPTFEAEKTASSSHRSLGTPLLVQTPVLVLRSRGRMGDFSGQAWAPALVPTDVNIADVLH